MEVEEIEKKKSSEGEKSTKRKMKTAFQLELLEQTYASEPYPSEKTRAELSEKLSLTDRQLQMWFCHRRLKDRKGPPVKRSKKEMIAGSAGEPEDEEMMSETGFDQGPGSSVFDSIEPRKTVHAQRIGGDFPVVRYYSPPPPPPARSMAELRIISFIEAQLGEPLREDAPTLGVEFDPLPPGAFGAPLEPAGQPIPGVWSYDSKIYDRHDIKTIKAPHMMSDVEHLFVPNSSCSRRKQGIHVLPPSHSSLRAVHEYQFLPEKPTIRSDSYERGAPSHSYDSPVDAGNVRGTSLHVNEATSYNFESPPPNVILSSQGRHCHSYSSGSKEYGVTPRNSYPIGTDIGLHNTLATSDKKTSHDQEVSRIERKRKSEEAKIAKEVEAHEKRIRKELEKQDIIRRKREEQMRREMERLGRERKKEEERLMREKQREEERFRREQRRENERRERFLQKESLRAEKLRQKEALRREKEAARLKAANERATARRIAKESMELIEDERLELMELAASSKGLPSMLSLDCETLMNLDMFRDILPTFPPKSVQLKKPFAVRPWIDSEESVGNLLMVWRFLTTFADVLKIWPFTLDEFVQALHDYEPRLLGEVHISLLKCIIKDIEDVARTPSTGMGVNQNSAANPVGGHPQIVEGAYTWGFDIRSWQYHLNPLTWPEILRQFALSAGLGPRIKKRSIERRFLHEDNEGQDGEDIISTLRNGSAAENAFAIMHVKGFSHPRRSRHRLTPGTVKFAAYHVLSLEGSQGLTILEVADKIQKSGLRDLTTSKTPEASIAAALSRDTTLFERTAPSTYCVRAPYRKDPADANAILSAAREKIQAFQSGYSDSEAEKDAEDVDDVERDEVSDSDGAEEPEVENDQNVGIPNEGKMNEHELQRNDIGQSSVCQIGNSEIGSPSFSLKSSKDKNIVGAEGQSLKLNADEKHGSNINLEDLEIDESIRGEPWVQGLVESEYSDLSVEERLSALISLVGVAIQGNMLRVVLEERMEAANSLKKQMWAEAQLDKRRMKEDYVSKHQYAPLVGIKSEENINETNVEESNQNPLLEHDGKSDDVSLTPPLKQETTVDSNNIQNYSGKSTLGQDFVTLDNIQQPPQGYVAEKSRSQMKSLIGQKAEEMYVYRSLPLGQDRRRNRYWLFITSASRNDPGCGRIFFESKDGFWRLIDSEQAFDALLSSLDTRGIRESHLHSVLQKIESSFKEVVKKSLHGANHMDIDREFDSPNSMICVGSSDKSEYSSSFRIELAKDEKEKEASYKRYQELQKWIWKECSDTPILCAMRYGKKRSSELVGFCDVCHSSYLCIKNHCSSCHETFDIVHNSDMDFLKHVSECVKWLKVDPHRHGSNSFIPTRIEFVKSLLALIEASIPTEALQSFWTDSYREVWATKLHSSSSANELLQALTMLEGGIKRDYLHLKFETTNELLGFTVSEILNESLLYKPLPVLPWIPETTSAVTLRALELDSSICYLPEQKADMDKEKESQELMKFPSSYHEMGYFDPTEVPVPQAEYYPEEKWFNPVSTSGRKYPQVGGCSLRGRGRGRGGRGSSGSGGRWQSLTTINYPGSKISNENAVKVNRAQARKVRTRGRGTKRGKRTVRNRPRSAVRKTTGPESELGRFYTSAAFTKQHFSEGNESDSDNNGLPSTDEFENQNGAYNDIYTDKTHTMMEESDTDEEEDAGDDNIGEMDSDLDDEEEDGNGDDRGEMDGEEDYEDEGFMNGNEEDTDDDGDEEEGNDDGEGTPSSSEYSDS